MDVDLEETARKIARQAKATRSCPGCEEEEVSCGDDEANKRAYAIGNKMITEGKLSVGRQRLRDAIKDILDGTPEHCPECDRRLHRDKYDD